MYFHTLAASVRCYQPSAETPHHHLHLQSLFFHLKAAFETLTAGEDYVYIDIFLFCPNLREIAKKLAY